MGQVGLAKDQEVNGLLLSISKQIKGSMKVWGQKKEKATKPLKSLNKEKTTGQGRRGESTTQRYPDPGKSIPSLNSKEKPGGIKGSGSKRKGRNVGKPP